MDPKKIVAVAVAAALAVAAPIGRAHAGGGPPPEAGPPFPLTDPARIAAGKSRFDSTCAAFCHGESPALFIGRTDLERQYIYNTIRDGGKGATPMPPWGDVFSSEEIWELVAYVQSLGTPPDR
ncbi:c-type cytochrome [Methylobacterium sp. sgz302541]|uniref:c-type cytochrome n=1 Tax=unclassified Methylobacterium TaxID=2615210 RepID=UPI003D3581EA